MIVAAAVSVVLVGTIANLWWHGTVAEEQAIERNKLLDWETRLRRATNGIPVGGCRSLAECTRNLGRIDILSEQNAQLEEALETQRFESSDPSRWERP